MRQRLPLPAASLSENLRHDIHLQEYLEELGQVVGRSVDAEELGSLEQARTIRERSLHCPACGAGGAEIPLDEKHSERFRWFFQRLRHANPSPVYVWTPRTICCGTFLAPSLAPVFADFDLGVNMEGVLAFLSSDLEDALLFEFTDAGGETNGNGALRIETRGPNWAKVAY